MAKRIHNPHDLFLKATLSSPRAIQDFFQVAFPAHVRPHVNFPSIHTVNPHKVLPTLAELHPDFVFCCLIGNMIAYILLEHQSTIDWLMPLRYSQYDTATTADHIKNESAKKDKKGRNVPFPLIFNFCLYHGLLNQPYPYSTNSFDYLPNANLGSKLGMTLNVEFLLINLSMLPDHILETYGTFGLIAKLFKYRNEQNFFQVLGYELERCRNWILGIGMPAALGQDYWQSIYQYASSVLDSTYVSEESLLTLFEEKLFINKEEIMITINQQIQERGEKIGEKRGEEKKAMEVAKAMFIEGLSADLVTRVTKLPLQAIDQLRRG